MARCSGTTRSGTRCKREALEGSTYCTLHQDQAGDETGAGGEGDAAGPHESYRSPASDAAIVLGVAAVTWAVLRRFLRIF